MALDTRRWAIGVVPLAALFVFATQDEIGRVEADLTERATEVISHTPLDEPGLAVAGRDLALAGAAFTPEAETAVANDLRRLQGVRSLNVDAFGVILEATPYKWSLTREGDTLTASGAVPDAATRVDILAAAKAVASVKFIDSTEYRRGATAVFGACTHWAFNQVSRLSRGAVTFSDQTATIEGVAKTSQSFEAAIAALKKLPEGVTLTKIDIAPPPAAPYVFSASSIGGAVVLAGDAPSLEARARIVESAKQAFPLAAIDEKIGIASGAPAGDFVGAAAFALAEMAKLDDAKATLTGTELTIAGKARAPGAVEALDADVGSLPKGFTLASRAITPAVVAPFVLKIAKSETGLALSGFVPGEDVRKALDAAAAASAAAANDSTLIAAGGPDAQVFLGAANVALAALKPLNTGEARIEDSTLAIAGVAPDSDAYVASLAALQGLPAGFKLARQGVEPPQAKPYLFMVFRQGDALTIVGSAPSLELRDAVDADAAKMFPAASLTDRTQIAAGAPNGDFRAAADFLLAALVGLESGRASLSDEELSVAGAARAPGAAEDVLKALRLPPAGFSVAASDIVPFPASPYAFEIYKTPGVLRLVGAVPDPRTRAAFEAKAEATWLSVNDETVLASGLPAGADYLGEIDYALDILTSLATGSVALRDSALTARGVAVSSADYERALSLVGWRPAGVTLDTLDISPPTVSPYVFAASNIGGRLVLTGSAPSLEMRDAILQAAQAWARGDQAVDNRLGVALGAPDGDFLAAVTYALEAIANLDDATATLSDRRLEIVGRARAPGAIEALKSARGPPSGFTLDRLDVAPAEVHPFTFDIAKSAAEITIAGFVPDAASRDAIDNDAKAIFPKASLTDGALIAAGAPKGDFRAAVDFLLAALVGLKNGRATLSEEELSVAGEAVASGAAEETLKALRLPPAGFSVANAEIAPFPAKPYAFEIHKMSGVLRLVGAVPDLKARAAFEAKAEATGLSVSDDTVLASGLPAGADYLVDVDYALDILQSLATGSVAFRDGALTVRGDATSSVDYDRALSLVGWRPTGVTLDTVDISPPTVSPYVFSASNRDGKLVLSGSAPSLEARDAIADAAQSSMQGALTVENRLGVALGAPVGDFLAAVTYALKTIADLNEATATLTDQRLEIVGQARAPGVIETIETSPPPAGFTLERLDVVPAEVHPFTLDIAKSAAGIAVSGFVPDEASRVAIDAEAKGQGHAVEDETLLAVGLPRGVDFSGAVAIMLEALKSLEEGRATLADDEVSLSGRAADDASAENARLAIDALPMGTRLVAVTIETPPPPTSTPGPVATETPTPEPTSTEVATAVPTATLSPAPTEVATATPTPEPSPTEIATAEPTPVPTATPSPAPSSPEPAPTPVATATPTPEPSPTEVATAEPTPVPTRTPAPTPTEIATAEPTSIPTATPSPAPSTPEPAPTPVATATPTPEPSPTEVATAEPTPIPTEAPSPEPSPVATATPSPTEVATAEPTPVRTAAPSPAPSTPEPTPSPVATATPTPEPSPTEIATAEPTPIPTATPSPAPSTPEPTPSPVATATPTPESSPTEVATAEPTPVPTATPTPSPTEVATTEPTPVPTATPSPAPSTAEPSPSPVATATPTPSPTEVATAEPTPVPTATPSPSTPEPTPNPVATTTPSPVPSPTEVATAEPTPVPTATPEPAPSPVATATPAPTPEPSPTEVATAEPTPFPTPTASSPEPAPSPVATATPTPMPSPTELATAEPTPIPTATPSPAPSAPEPTPSPAATATPTPTPTPTEVATAEPTQTPSPASTPGPVAEDETTPCDTAIRERIDGLRIRFDSDDAEIGEDGRQLLKQAARVAIRCKVARIEILGHTDMIGRTPYNDALALARANAALQVLAENGVPQEALVADPLGPHYPIASNLTRPGRALNRRVELRAEP